MKNKLKGVTLLETVIYIALFSLMIFMIVDFMLSTQENTLRTERKGQIHKSSEFVIQHLESSFDTVISVSPTNSIFESQQGVLELIFGSGTKQYSIQSSTIYFDGIPITPTSVRIENFYLEPVYQGGSDIVGVRVSMLFVSTIDSDVTEEINMLFSIR